MRLGTLARGGVLDRRPARPWALPRAFLPRSRTPVPGGAMGQAWLIVNGLIIAAGGALAYLASGS